MQHYDNNSNVKVTVMLCRFSLQKSACIESTYKLFDLQY